LDKLGLAVKSGRSLLRRALSSPCPPRAGGKTASIATAAPSSAAAAEWVAAEGASHPLCVI
jgi:hypothetical protein